MTPDERERIEAAVREAADKVWLDAGNRARGSVKILAALTPAIDALLAARDARIAELEEQLAAARTAGVRKWGEEVTRLNNQITTLERAIMAALKCSASCGICHDLLAAVISKSDAGGKET